VDAFAGKFQTETSSTSASLPRPSQGRSWFSFNASRSIDACRCDSDCPSLRVLPLTTRRGPALCSASSAHRPLSRSPLTYAYQGFSTTPTKSSTPAIPTTANRRAPHPVLPHHLGHARADASRCPCRPPLWGSRPLHGRCSVARAGVPRLPSDGFHRSLLPNPPVC
jgi:hypothetical protein